MRHSLKIGFSFGLTSGIITTLGLMVGLHAGTQSRLAVIGGILTIAVSDAFSDALGIHVSQETERQHSAREIWEATLVTFFTKFLFALTFIFPILLFEFSQAILVNIVWGVLILSLFSFFLAKRKKENPWKVVSEHVFIALLVVCITHFLGDWLSSVLR